MESMDEFCERVLKDSEIEIQAQYIVTMITTVNSDDILAIAKNDISYKNLETQNKLNSEFGGIVLISGNSLAASKYREMSDSSFDFNQSFIFPMYKINLEHIVKKLSGSMKIDFTKLREDCINVFVFYRGEVALKYLSFKERFTNKEHIAEVTKVVNEKINNLNANSEYAPLLNKLKGL